MRAARATGRGRRSGIAALGALWAALASTGDHLLAVNASPARLGRRPDNRGRGRLRSVCVLVWVRAAEAGRNSVASTPGTGQAGWRGMTTTGDDRTPLLAAPRPLPRATPTRSSWSLQKPKGTGSLTEQPTSLVTRPDPRFPLLPVYLQLQRPYPVLTADTAKRAGATLPNSSGHLRARF